ncbi:TonB family C-terminal domain-containing protein [Sphingomonas guangdongensis]|uniref:TonB family C-terminal domain-containing protein n=1 Tax=Sphingomonas guangdongensis TaxID=1141890 RepID=A0A285R3Q4_9SPHN|nr:energy transducer TonB [Sphingomonas guangdongensis]SOB86992.1 TonB family C-terminal domain-containing protein [Sphingomonas guangdongensis]
MDDLEDLSRRQARAQNGVDPTRDRPPPWFVGSGRSLVTAVVIVLAVLVVLRIWSTVELAREGWRWWREQPTRVDVPPQTHPPAPPAPPARSRSYDPAEWITADDYPAQSIRREEEGTVAIQWTVAPDGDVTACRVAKSSGFARLDAAACSAILENGRYPAVAPGQPLRTYSRRVVWRLPDEF